MERTILIKEKTVKGDYNRWGRSSSGLEHLPGDWYDVLNTDAFGLITLAVNLSERNSGKPKRYQPSVKHLYKVPPLEVHKARKEIVWK